MGNSEQSKKSDKQTRKSGLQRLEGYERPLKPKYIGPTLVDVVRQKEVDDLAEEFNDIFSPDQLEMHELWKRNLRNRQKEAAKRRAKIEAKLEETGYMKEMKLTSSDTYSLKRVFSLRNNIMEALKEDRFKFTYEGRGSKKFDADSVIGDHISEAMHAILPPFYKILEAKKRVVEQSLYALLTGIKDGYPLTEDYRNAAWILAANVDKLRAGEVIVPWESQQFPEWVPVQAIDSWPGKKKMRSGPQSGRFFKFICIGGRPATHAMRTVMFGLPRRGDRISMASMCGLRAWVLIEPGDCLEFTRVGCNSAFESANRKLIKSRVKACPAGLRLPCTTCHVGLDTCGRAVHYETYDLRDCRRCGKVDAHFRTVDNSTQKLCLGCRAAGKKGEK